MSPPATQGSGGWVHAVFESPADVRDALGLLAESGVAGEDVEVRSSTPLHDLGATAPALRSRVPLMAVLGGVLGGVAAFLLASLTARAADLPTGGMPIVPLPPFGIITFEGVAVGAILSVVGTVLYEGRLLARPPRPGRVDRHLADGKVIVSIRAGSVPSGRWASRALLTETTGEERR